MCGGNNTDLYFMPFSRRDRSASGRLYLAVDVVLGCTPPRADTANIVPPLSLSGLQNVTFSAPS